MEVWVLWAALAELWEALEELWEGLYIEKLPINRPSGRYVKTWSTMTPHIKRSRRQPCLFGARRHQKSTKSA